MAKSSRASTVKANNRRLKSRVFGPVEAARAERLSAKLLELAAQSKPPKPEKDAIEMDLVGEELGGEEEVITTTTTTTTKKTTTLLEVVADEATAMDVDTNASTEGKISRSISGGDGSSDKKPRKRIEKRRKTSRIVFPKYKDRLPKKGKR